MQINVTVKTDALNKIII